MNPLMLDASDSHVWPHANVLTAIQAIPCGTQRASRRFTAFGASLVVLLYVRPLTPNAPLSGPPPLANVHVAIQTKPILDWQQSATFRVSAFLLLHKIPRMLNAPHGIMHTFANVRIAIQATPARLRGHCAIPHTLST